MTDLTKELSHDHMDIRRREVDKGIYMKNEQKLK
jgi:hypothetical protein